MFCKLSILKEKNVTDCSWDVQYCVVLSLWWWGLSFILVSVFVRSHSLTSLPRPHRPGDDRSDHRLQEGGDQPGQRGHTHSCQSGGLDHPLPAGRGQQHAVRVHRWVDEVSLEPDRKSDLWLRDAVFRAALVCSARQSLSQINTSCTVSKVYWLLRTWQIWIYDVFDAHLKSM